MLRGRGRPPKSEDDRKPYKVYVRLTTNQYHSLLEHAERAGIPVSDYIRYCIEETIDREDDRERMEYYDED